MGAAPIHRETLEFFMGFDVPILELYGMSESAGPHTSNIKEFKRWRTGSCGKNITGTTTKIDNPDEHGDGEVSDHDRYTLVCPDHFLFVTEPAKFNHVSANYVKLHNNEYLQF